MTIDEVIALFETTKIMEVIGWFFLFNLSLTTIELLLDIFTHKERRWKDTVANLVIFLVNNILEKTFYGSIGFILLLPFYIIAPFQIEMNIRTWILAVFLADLTYYWMHRIEHEHRIFWAHHSVHHSSEDYNLTVASRLSVIEGLIEWIFLIPMILIGFNPFQAIVGIILVAQYQHWVHTERVQKLGILDEVFNTPSVHRVHHGSNRKYLDKNYGGILMIWDKLFGTFERESEKVVYGLTRNIHTNNPIKINFIEYKNIWDEVKQCRNMRDKLKIIFGNLWWKPKYFKEKHK